MATLPLKGGSNFSAVASRESLFLKNRVGTKNRARSLWFVCARFGGESTW